MPRRFLLLAAPFVLFALVLSSCATADTVQGTGSQKLLSVHRATRTADLVLLAGARGGLDFDGASGGAMTVTVPLGWRVDVTCLNYSTVLTHSCAIVDPGQTRTAFAGAAIANPTVGLAPTESAQFSFVASRVGRYQIVCLVPGHRDAGMWDWFVVRSGGLPVIRGANPPPSA